jgi:hypothetical protein
MEKIDQPAWSFPVAVQDIPEMGEHLDIEASETDRAAVAQFAGLRSLPSLTAHFDLARQGAGVRVSGRVTARVGQNCVVTLEPIESDVEEVVDLVFVPGDAPGAVRPEVDKPVEQDEEAIEPLVGGVVDLGKVATEFLLLGIDPYPRKAGAKFVPPKTGDSGAHPFAALEALKKPSGSGKRDG